MRVMKAVSAVMMVVLFGVTVTGAEDKKPNPPVTWSTTLPAIELSNQPLEKVLNELKQKLPGFDFSISRENVPHDYPVLPALTVENVTLEQFLQLISSAIPGVQVQNNYVVGDDNKLFAKVDITPNPNISSPVPPVVRIFGLNEIIQYRAPLIKGNGDHEKQASDDILSLIQAALEVAGDSPMPVLKIHAPTKTLIFKGTAEQADVVANALDVLQPAKNPRSFQASFDAEDKEISLLREELKKLQTPSTKPAK